MEPKVSSDSCMTTQPCPRCSGNMRLMLALPAAMREELHTFECTKCGHNETVSLRYWS
jgi:hypothetical protein